MVDFLIGVDGGGTATRTWLAPAARARLVQPAEGPVRGALTMIRHFVEQQQPVAS